MSAEIYESPKHIKEPNAFKPLSVAYATTPVSKGWNDHHKELQIFCLCFCSFFFHWILLIPLGCVPYILFYVLHPMIQAQDISLGPNILVTHTLIWNTCAAFNMGIFCCMPMTINIGWHFVTSKLSWTISESLAAHPFTMQFVKWAAWQSQEHSFAFSEQLRIPFLKSRQCLWS